MKDLRTLDKYRTDIPAARLVITDPSKEGIFGIGSIMDRQQMIIIAAGGHGWEHLSISRGDRPPHWIEMEQVKRMFFEDTEWAMQLHPPVAQYVSGKWPGRRSLFVLHIWRPLDAEIPKPPRWMVGANSQLEWDIMKPQIPTELQEESDG